MREVLSLLCVASESHGALRNAEIGFNFVGWRLIYIDWQSRNTARWSDNIAWRGFVRFEMVLKHFCPRNGGFRPSLGHACRDGSGGFWGRRFSGSLSQENCTAGGVGLRSMGMKFEA
jgi:hypothetical protein